MIIIYFDKTQILQINDKQHYKSLMIFHDNEISKSYLENNKQDLDTNINLIKMEILENKFQDNMEVLLLDNKIVFVNFLETLSLQNKKILLLAKLDAKYQNTRQIHIENGYQFIIDLASNSGKEFIEKIKISCNQIQDYNTATNFQAHSYFQTITIIQDGKEMQKQIEVLMLNWLWKYVFEEVLVYIEENKKKYEAFKKDIENSVLINELLSIDIQFPMPDGLTLDVNKVFDKLIDVVKGIATETYLSYKIDEKTGVGITEEVKLEMPSQVIMVLKAKNLKPYPIFDDISLVSINNKIQKVLQSSFFNK